MKEEKRFYFNSLEEAQKFIDRGGIWEYRFNKLTSPTEKFEVVVYEPVFKCEICGDWTASYLEGKDPNTCCACNPVPKLEEKEADFIW